MAYLGFFIAGVAVGAALLAVYAMVIAARDIERMDRREWP